MDATEILQQGLTELAEVFEARGVRYALIGGLAVGYRSLFRNTEDIDLVLSVPQLVLPAVLEDLQARGFDLDMSTVIREWNAHGMTAFKFRGLQVDWLKPLLPCVQEVIDTATSETWLSVPVRVATVEGLIVMKTFAMRLQDQLDISRLLAANRGVLDIEHVRATVSASLPHDDPRLAELEEMMRQHYDRPDHPTA
jgi:hypothetical protein